MTLLPKIQDKKAIIAKDGLGNKVTGQLVFIKSLETDDLIKIIEDKIVLIDKIDKVSLFKSLGLGALGVITKELEDFDFLDLSGRYFEEPFLIVSDEDFKKLEKHDRKDIQVNPEEKSITFL